MGKSRKLSLFNFLSLTALMVLTVYEYPTFATAKLHLLFFVIIFGIFWFMPISLVAAEMASVKGWEDGGVYGWVGNALSQRFGFAAIFFEWFQVTVSFVTMSYFVLGACAYIFNCPALNNNPWIKFIGVLIIFWGLTFTQFSGTKKTAQIAQIGFLAGILLPSLIIFVFALWYVIKGGKIMIDFGWHQFIPNFTQLSTLVVASSFILAFGGIEASAPHINELKNPKKNYPLVIIMLIFLTIFLDGAGGLSVAVAVPQKQLSLSAGVIQAFSTLVHHFYNHLDWFVKLMAFLIAFGVIAEIASWIIGPTKGIYVAAQKGLLPAKFRGLNSKGVPVPILIMQGLVVTVWDAILTFGGGSDNVSFLAAVSLTVVIYLLCYILIFISYISLIFRFPKRPRSYSAPGGKFGKICLAISGLVLSIFAFLISFVTPSSLSITAGKKYQFVLILSFSVAVILPFVIYAMRKHFGKENRNFKVQHVESKDVNKFIHPIGRSQYLTEHEIANKKH